MDAHSQIDFLPSKGAELSIATEEEIARLCKSRHHALVRSYEASCLTPKQLQGSLECSQSTVSKILGGTAHPDPEIYFRWMATCGNLIPFRYDAHVLRHAVTPIQSTLEAELAQAKKDLEFERELNRRLMQHRS